MTLEKKGLSNANSQLISLFLNLIVVILSVSGILATVFLGGFMSSNLLLYFTIQSNITMVIISATFFAIYLTAYIKKKDAIIPRCLYILKFLFTVAISLTFLVFWAFLMPPMLSTNASYLFSYSNFTTHTLAPIFAILDFIFFSKGFENTRKDFVYGIAMPLYYLFFAMICSFSGVVFDSKGATVPYFFLDYKANGWFLIGDGKLGVAYWIVLMIAIVLLLAYLLMKAKEKLCKLPKKAQII